MKWGRTIANVSVCAFSLLAATQGLAQDQNVGANISGPGVVLDRGRPDHSPQLPMDKPASAPSGEDEAVLADTDKIPPFVLNEVRVEGASVPASVIGEASRPFIGQTMDRGKLEALAHSLAAAYEESDVALYTIAVPRQDFSSGILRLVILEGYVSAVALHVEGNRKVTPQIEAYGRKLIGARPLTRARLERYLSLIRDIPGLGIEADLQRTSEPGGVRLAMDGKQRTFSAGLAVNNRGTAFLGRTQVTLSADVYSMLRPADHTEFVVAVPTEVKRFQYYAIGHTQILNDEGTMLRFNAAYLRTRPQSVPLNGDAVLGSIQLLHPLIRRYDRSLYVGASLDGLNSSHALLGQNISDERTRAFRLLSSWSEASEKMAYSIGINGSFGIDGLGSRASLLRNAKTGFRKVNIEASFNRKLTKPLILRLKAGGQYSGHILPSSEMFTLGGDLYGRAFEGAAVTGDYGYGGSAEIAFVPENLSPLPEGTEFYAFTDGGKAWTRVSGFGKASFSLVSAGLGTRVPVNSKLMAELEVAKPVKLPVEGFGSKGARFVFSIRSRL